MQTPNKKQLTDKVAWFQLAKLPADCTHNWQNFHCAALELTTYVRKLSTTGQLSLSSFPG